MRLFHDVYQQVRDGLSQIVGIRGEAGIGKSRLLAAFAEDLRATSDPVFASRCTESPSAPLMPLLRLLGRAVRDESIPEATRRKCATTVEQLFASPDHGDPNRAELFFTLTELLIAVTSGRPAVLIFDDVQWSDRATSDYLEFLATELIDDPQQTRMLLVLAERSDLDAGGRAGRCCARLAPWTELRPLDDEEQRLLVQKLGVARPSPKLMTDLRRRTAGNTLHLVETIRELAADGAFVERNGWIDTVRTIRTSVPRDLAETVRNKTEGLPARTRQVLEALAVLGDESQTIVLSRQLEMATVDLDEHLAPAIDAGVVEHSDLGVLFSHPLYRTVLEQQLPEVRRRELHGRAAVALLAAMRSSTDERIADIAPHIVAAGSALSLHDKQALEILTTAAQDAFATAGWDEAYRYYAAALNTAGGSDRDEGWLHYRAGRSAELGFNWHVAEHHFDEAARAAERIDDPALGAWSAIARLHVETTSGNPPQFHDQLDTTDVEHFIEQLEPAQGSALVVTRTQLSQSLASAGEHDRAERYASEALDFAERSGEVALQVRAEMTAGLAASFRLDLETALWHYRRGVALADRIGDVLRAGHGETRIALIKMMTGDLAGSQLACETARARNIENKQWGDLALLAGVRAQICLLQGDFVGIEIWGREAEHYISLSNYPFAPGILYPVLAAGRLLQGEQAAAERALDRWSDVTGRTHSSWRAMLNQWSDDTRIELTPFRRPRTLSLPNLGRILLRAEITDSQSEISTIDKLLATIPDSSVVFAPGSACSVQRAQAMLAGRANDRRPAVDLATTGLERCRPAGAVIEVSSLLSERGRHRAFESKQAALSDLLQSWRLASGVGASLLSAQAERLAATVDPAFEMRLGDTQPSRSVVMFVDMVGSVAISVRSDQLYVDLVDRLFSTVKRRLAEFGGAEFGSAGDALLASFDTASAAAHCALGIHADVEASAGREHDDLLALKIGIANGDLLERDGNLYGRVVNLAARLSDRAEGGQTITTAALAQDLPLAFPRRSLGNCDLKGFDDPIELIAIEAEHSEERI